MILSLGLFVVAGSLLLYFTSFILDVSTLPFAIVIAITVLISAGLIFGTYYHVRQMQNRLLSCSSEPIIADEDEYWAKGYYCNPHDTNTTIEKRIGYGYTYNMATAKGKAMTYGSLIAAAALFLGLTALFMVMDFTPIRMTVDGGTVKISAPMYGYEFPAVDIQSVSLEETLPSSGIRTNGASTAQYDLGNFSVPEYGAVKAYLYKQYPPFLVIELPDLYVIINSKSSEVTQEYYDLLMQTMSK